MNWAAVSAVVEMLGLIAVVISLIYLAIQVRIQNREARLAAMHEISVALRETNASFIADAEMAIIFDKANSDFVGLSNHEKIRLAVCLQSYFRVWEEAYMQYEANRLDERIWKTMLRQFASFLAAPAVQQIWDQRKSYYDEKFKLFVENLPRTAWGID